MGGSFPIDIGGFEVCFRFASDLQQSKRREPGCLNQSRGASTRKNWRDHSPKKQPFKTGSYVESNPFPSMSYRDRPPPEFPWLKRSEADPLQARQSP